MFYLNPWCSPPSNSPKSPPTTKLFFFFSEPRGGYELLFIVRLVKNRDPNAQSVNGTNDLVQKKKFRVLVNTSTSVLSREVIVNVPQPHQLTDDEFRPLLSLPRQTLHGLARIISFERYPDLEPAER